MRTSDHFDGQRFFNPERSTDRTLMDLLRWLSSGQRARWPAWVGNARVPSLPQQVDPEAIALTFVNHATFLVQASGVNVLTDPVWALRASPVRFAGPKRVHHPGVAFESLPPVQIVLVSHNHYDHLDIGTLRRLQQTFGCRFVTTLGNREFLRRRGLRDVTELDWWDEHQVDGVTITATPAQHFSARTPFDRNRTLWAGFALQLGGLRLFFAGDSGYGAHFRQIRARLGPFAAALVPIGAYEPRWFMEPAHMNPDEAVRVHLDLGSPLTIAMHFGCFQLTDEAIDEPIRALERARAAHGVAPDAFRVPEIGETIVVKGVWG